jgi:DNA polymerase III delta subunit
MAAKKKARDPSPDEELARLRAALQQDLPCAVILRGAEAWYREAGARVVLEAATVRGDELCRHDGKDPEFSLGDLLDDLIGGSLFAGARTIRFLRADSRVKKGARNFAPGLVEAVKRRLASGVPGSLIIEVENLRADHALVKATTAAGGLVIGCRRLWDSPPPWDPDPRRTELVQWLILRARERKIELSPDEAVYLSKAVGNDLAGLLDRLDQLRDRGGKGLQELVGWDAGGSPWDVAERLVDGDAARAVAGSEALLRGGFQGKDGTRTVDRAGLLVMLTGAVTGKVREAAAGSAALAGGANPKQALSLVRVGGGPRAQEAFLARLRQRSAAQWGHMLEQAGDLERRARSGATVDANDLAVLALRWAVRRR